MALTQVAGGMLAGSITSSQISSVAGSTITGSQSIPKSTLPTGSVLQIVQGTAASQISTTSATYVDSTLSVSITPTSSSSKVLVCVTLCGIYIANAGNWLWAGVVRNSTLIADNFTGAGPGYNGSNGGTGGAGSINYLDSPATTSAVTYKVQYKSAISGQAVYLMNGSGPLMSITVMEISA